MFRYLIVGYSLLVFPHDVSADVATAVAVRPFRFAEVKRVKEVDGLPPKLKIVLDLMCNEKFLKVIRHDETDPRTGKVTIALGALVEENLLSSCAGESKRIEVPAGKSFSGRQFSVSLIKK